MSERKVKGTFTVEGARMIYRNFSGKKTEFNDEGNRNFGLLISDEDAEKLLADGWNVKYKKPKEDDPDQYRQPWLPVKVKFGEYPPSVYIIQPNDGNPRKIRLAEENIGQLDWSYIESCDVQVRPYNYPARPGRPAGVTAYLKSLYVFIKPDPFEQKYGSIPEFEEYEEHEERENEEVLFS